VGWGQLWARLPGWAEASQRQSRVWHSWACRRHGEAPWSYWSSPATTHGGTPLPGVPPGYLGVWSEGLHGKGTHASPCLLSKLWDKAERTLLEVRGGSGSVVPKIRVISPCVFCLLRHQEQLLGVILVDPVPSSLLDSQQWPALSRRWDQRPPTVLCHSNDLVTLGFVNPTLRHNSSSSPQLSWKPLFFQVDNKIF